MIALLAVYLRINLLILVAAAVCGLLERLVRRGNLGARTAVRISYLSLLLALVFPLLPLPSSSSFFEPVAKIWTAPSWRQKKILSEPGEKLPLSVTALGGTGISQIKSSPRDLFLILGLVSLALAVIVAWDLGRLRKLIAKSTLIRRLGRVAVYISDEARVPFSHLLPGRAAVVLPANLVGQGADLRVSLLHEFQHHRQGDTASVYFLALAKILNFWNPGMHVMLKRVSELQEFACDEALVDRKCVSSEAYAGCLLRVAETALGMGGKPVCATGLTFPAERHLLIRRIKHMLHDTRKTSRSMALALALVCIFTTGGIAWATKELIRDQRVTVAQANAWLANAKPGSEFPLAVNELVLEELNRFVGTPDGREFMRRALERMEHYAPLVNGKLDEYRVPQDLRAIPIIESGYKNLAQDEEPMHGAGLWMFIASTAQRFGLTVEPPRIDERLNESLETDAAMRYLVHNRMRFQSWELAVLGYAWGENKVQELKDLVGPNAWAITRANPNAIARQYLPRLTAAILIMKNPEALR